MGTGVLLGNGPPGQNSSWGTVHWDRSPPWATRTGVLPVDFPLGQDLSWGMLHWDSPLVQEYLGVWSTGSEVLLGYSPLVHELSWVMVQCDRSSPGVWSTGFGVILRYVWSNVTEVLLGLVHGTGVILGYGPLVQELSQGLVQWYRSHCGPLFQKSSWGSVHWCSYPRVWSTGQKSSGVWTIGTEDKCSPWVRSPGTGILQRYYSLGQ
jgi:hypothetical protein